MGCKASKPVYTLHVQPTRLSLTESMNRFGGSDEKVEGSMSARRSSRRNSRRKSSKRLQSAHRTSMGKITARAGSFAEGHLQRQFAVSSFEMGKVCWLPHRCGRYTILVVVGGGVADPLVRQVIGTGLHAKVVLAKHKRSSHFFALKRFNKASVIRHKRLAYIADEMTALTHVSSPFIVKLHGSFQDERYVFVTVCRISVRKQRLHQHALTAGVC